MAPGTRQRLTETAARRFYRDGFRNVGLDQILDEVGISKTAFYKHFQSKDDLMVAVLGHMNGWLQDNLRKMIREEEGAGSLGSAAFPVRCGGADHRGRRLLRVQSSSMLLWSSRWNTPPPTSWRRRTSAPWKTSSSSSPSGRELLAPELLAQELCMIMDGRLCRQADQWEPGAPSQRPGDWPSGVLQSHLGS